MKITFFDGGDRSYGATIQGVLRQLRDFLGATDDLGLAPSSLNLAHFSTCEAHEFKDQMAYLEVAPAGLRQPILPAFERDLASLHVRAPLYEEECAPVLEVVWRTSGSRRLFGNLLDASWEMAVEYGQDNIHRVLDHAT